MTGTTTGQTSLPTATDSDDTEHYLTVSLPAGLQTLADKFDSTTGHDHSGSGDGAPIGAGSITATMIANRTRSRWFSAAEFQISSGTPTFSTGTVSAPYWLMADAAQSAVATSLAVPNDWASGALTFNLYFSPLASGSVGSREVNITLTTTNTTPGTVVSGGSTTDDISTSATSDGLTVTAHSRTVTPAAAGDLVGIVVQRNGAAGTDDLASQVRFYGVRVDYLADG